MSEGRRLDARLPIRQTGLDWILLGNALGRRLIILGPLFLAVLCLGIWVGWLLVLGGAGDVDDNYPKIDFTSFYTASALALEGEASAAYDDARMIQEQLDIPGHAGHQTWRNPPVFFYMVLPFSLLSFSAALGAWGLATGALLLSAVRRISREPAALILTLAFPATFWNLLVGQNGLLSAALLAWGMVLLKDRPVHAGIVLGLMTFKPQFFPLVLVALIAGRQRSAAIATTGTVATLSLASLVFFGLDSWSNFVSIAVRSKDEIYTGVAALHRMQSVSAFLLVSGAPPLLAQLLQGIVSIAAAAFVFWLWRKEVALEYRAAGLAIAILYATPYSYHTDLPIMGVAILWLALRMQEDGWLPGDAPVLALAWLTPFLTLVTAAYLGFSLGPIVMLAMLAILLRRIRSGQTVERFRQPSSAAIAVRPPFGAVDHT
jgi:hypothetical protein